MHQNSKSHPQGKTEIYILLSLIILFIFIVYSNSLSCSFVWDDVILIVENPIIKGFKFLKLIFLKDFFDIFGDEYDFKYGYWRPIITLSYMVDYHFWNLSPSGFHLTNILLHTLNSLLVFFVLHSHFKELVIPFIASFIFAIHPIHTESVTWVSGRTDVLAATFFLISLLTYQKSRNHDGRVIKLFYFISIFSFCIAMLSKEMAVILPLVLIAYNYFILENGLRYERAKKSLILSLPYFFVILFYLYLRFVLLKIHATKPIEDDPAFGFYPTLLSFIKSVLIYTGKMFFPVTLSAYIQNPPSITFFDPKVIFSLCVLIVFFIALIRIKNKEFVFYSLFYLFTFIPLSNFLRISAPADMGFVMAERFLYIPSIPFVAIIAIAILYACKSRKVIFYLLILTLTVFFSSRIILRNKDFKDDEVFFTKTVRQTPSAPLLHHCIGNVYVRKGLLDEAFFAYKRALVLSPGFFVAYNNIATIYTKKGMKDEAIEEFKSAIAVNPTYLIAYYNLGTFYGDLGLYDEAISTFNKALKINPRYVRAYNGLGIIYAKREEFEKAGNEFKKALEINPSYEYARINFNLAKQMKKNPQKGFLKKKRI